MKATYYHGNGVTIGVENFRPIDVRADNNGKIIVDGYNTVNSTEYKATLEFTFDEALDYIEKLKKQVAEMPCPLCHRK